MKASDKKTESITGIKFNPKYNFCAVIFFKDGDTNAIAPSLKSENVEKNIRSLIKLKSSFVHNMERYEIKELK